ncbi:hypothetical protein [Labilibaculum filiforme]|uniref:hypothetical protein n=1 Tax=Labilibaculum filiforme TaxID=1940526 RepID=UPI001C59462F|nr:hypothetical protein [Labilibaculum filiforme]
MAALISLFAASEVMEYGKDALDSDWGCFLLQDAKSATANRSAIESLFIFMDLLCDTID